MSSVTSHCERSENWAAGDAPGSSTLPETLVSTPDVGIFSDCQEAEALRVQLGVSRSLRAISMPVLCAETLLPKLLIAGPKGGMKPVIVWAIRSL